MLLNQSKKGNKMKINECYLSELKARKVKQNNRLNWVLAGIGFILYCIVSNMSFNDCLNMGVC